MAQVALPHGKYVSVSDTKLPDGRWRARTRVGYRDGERLTSFQVSRIRQTKKEALAAIPEAVAEALESREQAKRGPGVPQTMGELLRDWRDSLADAGVHGRTRQDYGYAVSALLGEAKAMGGSRAASPAAKAFAPIARLAPKDVTQVHVKALLVAVANGSGPAAAERVRSVLRNVFHRAADYGLATSNPAIGLRYTKSDASDYRTKAKSDDGLDHGRAPTDDEVRDLLLALASDARAGRQVGQRTRGAKGARLSNPQDIHDLTYLLFSLGCRQGEALALRYSDLNLGAKPVKVRVERISRDTRRRETATVTVPPGSVSINATLARVVGQGLVRDLPKSPAGSRVIPMSPSLQALLRERADALGIDWAARPEVPIFGALIAPERFREPRSVAKAIAALYDAHGVTWHRSHGARKYVTTTLHRLGYDDARIMRYLGWDNPATLFGYLDRGQELPEDMALSLDVRPSLTV